MKTRNSIRAEINALYRNKVINWLSDSVKSKSVVDPVRIYLGAPTKDEDVLSNKDEFLAFCEDWHKELTAGKVDFIEKTYPLVEYYKKNNALVSIDSVDPDETIKAIEGVIND